MGSYVPNTYRPVPVHTGSGSFRFMLVPVPTGSRLTETRLPVPGSVRGFPDKSEGGFVIYVPLVFVTRSVDVCLFPPGVFAPNNP